MSLSISKLISSIKDISIYQSVNLSFILKQIESNTNSDHETVVRLVIDGSKTKVKDERLNDSTLSLIFRELLQLLKQNNSNNTNSFISTLETIDFRNNDIEFASDESNYFYEFLKYCSTNQIYIKHLNFQNNMLSQSSINELLTICLDLPSIESINLSYNTDLGREGASTISKYLTLINKIPNNNLKSLYLNNCGFDLTSMIGIIVSLSPSQESSSSPSSSSSYLQLETLELNRPIVDKTPQEEFIEHLSRLIANLNKNQITTANTLSSLSLKYCCISNWGIERFFDCLKLNPLKSIRNLNFEGNAINNVGAITISNYLKSSSQKQGLESLGLSCNLIGDDGCVAIAKVLVIIILHNINNVH